MYCFYFLRLDLFQKIYVRQFHLIYTKSSDVFHCTANDASSSSRTCDTYLFLKHLKHLFWLRRNSSLWTIVGTIFHKSEGLGLSQNVQPFFAFSLPRAPKNKAPAVENLKLKGGFGTLHLMPKLLSEVSQGPRRFIMTSQHYTPHLFR